MNCSGCNKVLNSAHRHLVCKQCRGKYHIECLNIKTEQYSALTSEFRAKWICPSCNNVTRRTRCNVNTPVRQSQVPGKDDSMDVSYNLENATASSPTYQRDVTAEVITMDKMSALLDQKLQAYLSDFKETFRKDLKVYVHDLVQAEMHANIQLLKDDFTTTTDFICDQQTSLKRDIENKAQLIKDLESSNVKLQSELNILSHRLASIEKMTRSQNLEIQAVPEGRGDNPIAMFQNLCKKINIEISDDKILACRRVAKLNPSSHRPRNILVSLVNPRLRDQVLSACHRYNKVHKNELLDTTHLGLAVEKQRIYVSEHLSPDCKALHAAARKAARERGYKYVWVRYGRIYIRKEDSAACIHVKNMDSLNKL